MPISYQNIQELNNSAGVSISNKVEPGWKLNSDSAKAAAQFYEQWAVYLSPQIRLVHEIASLFLGALAKLLYFFSYSIEEIFNSMFKLFGFLSFIGDRNTFIGSMYFWFQALGTVVFIFLLIVRVVTSFLGNRVRLQSVVNHLLLVTAVTAFLPVATQATIQILVPTVQNVSQNSKGASLSLQPIIDNTVDINVLMENSWDVDKLGYEEDTGYLNVTKATLDGGQQYFNYITDNNLYSVNFGESYGASEKDVLKEFIEMSDGDKQSPYYGMADLLSSKLTSNFQTEQRQVTKIDKGSNIFKEFSYVYPRFVVNWLPMYLQQIIVGLVLIMIAVIFATAVFNIVVQTMIAPIVGYSSVEDSTKFKDLLSTLIGGYAGIVFQVILLRIAMEIMRSYKTIGLGGDSLSSGLSYWQNLILSFIIYISMYFVVMNGSRAIDRWLGINSRNTAGLAAGYLAGRGALRTISKAPGNINKAVRNFQKNGNGVKKSPLPSGKGGPNDPDRKSPLPPGIGGDLSEKSPQFDELFKTDSSPLPKGESPTGAGGDSPTTSSLSDGGGVSGDSDNTPPNLPKTESPIPPRGRATSPLPKESDPSGTGETKESSSPKQSTVPPTPASNGKNKAKSPLPPSTSTQSDVPGPKPNSPLSGEGTHAPSNPPRNTEQRRELDSPISQREQQQQVPTHPVSKQPSPQSPRQSVNIPVPNPKKEQRLNDLNGLEKKGEFSLDDF